MTQDLETLVTCCDIAAIFLYDEAVDFSQKDIVRKSRELSGMELDESDLLIVLDDMGYYRRLRKLFPHNGGKR